MRSFAIRLWMGLWFNWWLILILQDRSPTGLATEVYAHTTQGDKLRALLVDLHVWKGK
jgi:hypothetical protein